MDKMILAAAIAGIGLVAGIFCLGTNGIMIPLHNRFFGT